VIHPAFGIDQRGAVGGHSVSMPDALTQGFQRGLIGAATVAAAGALLGF